MELNEQEEKLIKSALRDLLEKNKSKIDHFESLGFDVRHNKHCKEYEAENEAIFDLLDRFYDE